MTYENGVEEVLMYLLGEITADEFEYGQRPPNPPRRTAAEGCRR